MYYQNKKEKNIKNFNTLRKASNKVQYELMIKTLSKLKMDGRFPQSTAVILFNDDVLNAFPQDQ